MTCQRRLLLIAIENERRCVLHVLVLLYYNNIPITIRPKYMLFGPFLLLSGFSKYTINIVYHVLCGHFADLHTVNVNDV